MKSPPVRRLISLLSSSALVATLAVATLPAVASADAPPAPYVNGFENAVDVGATDQAMFNVSQVATGPGAITSASGSYHALAATASSAFTRYGGYSSAFPTGGYTTSVDIFLDTAASAAGVDLRFDWSSAITNTAGTHLRDFAFNVGTNGSGGFVMTASNNTGRGSANPANTDRSPITISTSGWYTFQHHFYDSGSGVLAANLTVRALGSATVLGTWTLSDPTDIIGTTVGGNRYGWLVNNELPLALDNITRSGVLPPKCTVTGLHRDSIDLTAAVINPTAPVTGTVDATTCNIGVYFGPGQSGSVSGATIFGANYYGVVVNAAAVNVIDSTIRNIGETPLNGSQHGVGVLYTTIDQAGTITGTAATGTVSGNTVSDYQKNGITASGAGTSVSILNNVVTGEGPIPYIAQNGIQVSYGASAVVKGNTVTGDYYTGATWTACGLLFYQAGGVKQSANVFSGNQTNVCNAGRGGGNVRP